eukprot:INCI2829.2.p1 GENE.INCI2829.2~~INCI2829.2.p1  ORF type:complete len:402 (+),score=56.83 INCI2829.2:183-1388(+)
MTAATSDGKRKLDKAGATKKKRGVFQKMAVRSFFAILMVAGMVAVYYLGHSWLCAFVVAVQVGAFVELTRVQHNYQENETEKGGLRLFRSLKFAWLAVALYTAYGMSWMIAPFDAGEAFFNSMRTHITEPLGLPSTPSHYHDLVSLGLFAAVFMVTVLSFQRGRYREQLLNISWTLTSLLVVVFQMKSAIKNIYHGVFWLVFPMALVIINDTMAYFAGVSCGRRFYKGVFLELSPNKTLEGFIGGGLFTLLAGFFLPKLGIIRDNPYIVCTYAEYSAGLPVDQCAFSHEFIPTNMDIVSFFPKAIQPFLENLSIPSVSVTPVQLHGLLLAAFASTVAPFGGFLASAIKRAYKVKDFSELIPEHGGIVDRMDCQFIMALVCGCAPRCSLAVIVVTMREQYTF